MKSVHVTLKGISPLLMHAFPLVPIEAIEKKTPQEQAEHGAYRDPESGELFIPAVNMQRALIAGAAYSKGKGRGSLQKQVAACVFVNPQRLRLGTKTFQVDARPVVIPATKGRIVRYRPMLETWAVSFDLDYDETLLRETELRQVMDSTGSRVGLLDFRPEKRGPFGRFSVVLWKAAD